jgi:thioredoxin 1
MSATLSPSHAFLSRPAVGCSPRAARIAAISGLALCAAVLVLVGGCAAANPATLVETGEEFQHQVVEANQPVLVEFFKGGCATCVILEPGLNQLAQEYRGRATIARYYEMNFVFMQTSQQITDRYRVHLVPTVLLLVNGQEKKRWFMEYNMDVYRQALDEVLHQTAAPKVAVGSGQTPGKS